MDDLLTELNNSGLNKNIFMSSSEPLAENMTHVCGPNSIAEIEISGCELVNTHHIISNDRFLEYEANNVSVMVWTVDLKSRFSQMWCLGVDYVKTNNLHLFVNMTTPAFYLIQGVYNALLGSTIALGTLGIPLFYIIEQIDKRKKETRLQNTDIPEHQNH